MPLLNILLADHHEITREGYMTVLRRSLAEVNFGHATNFFEAKAAYENKHWNLVIMEIAIPGGDGLDLLASIRQHEDPAPVLVSSSQDEVKYGLRSIQNGAAGYISKAAGVDVFLKGVQSVLEGRNYLSQTLAQNLVNHVRPSTHAVSHTILSEREHQVMLKLASGMAIKEIATEMAVSAKTISTYRARLLHKLNMTSLAEIVRYCLDNGLIQKAD